MLLVRVRGSVRWFWPGGGVEAGETVFEALEREVREETGLHLDPPYELLTRWTEDFFDLDSHEPWRCSRRFFAVSQFRGTLLRMGNGTETTAAQFIPLSALGNEPIDGAVGRVLALANAGYDGYTGSTAATD